MEETEEQERWRPPANRKERREQDRRRGCPKRETTRSRNFKKAKKRIDRYRKEWDE